MMSVSRNNTTYLQIVVISVGNMTGDSLMLRIESCLPALDAEGHVRFDGSVKCLFALEGKGGDQATHQSARVLRTKHHKEPRGLCCLHKSRSWLLMLLSDITRERIALEQGSPTWGYICLPEGVHLRLAIEEKNIFTR